MKRLPILSALVLLCCLTSASSALAQENASYKRTSIKAGIGGEYFSRTIKSDNTKEAPLLKSFLTTLDVEYELMEGFSLGLRIGYSSSQLREMIFRELPFSIDLADAGGIGGLVLGGEARKSLFPWGIFEINLCAQFVYYKGGEKSWKLDGLAVEGQLVGKPSWMRLSVGPVLGYQGLAPFYPYVFPHVNSLWGAFEINETIEELSGTEKKEIKGESLFGLALGAIYEFSDRFLVKGEFSLLPYQDGIDSSILLRALFSF